ncbi:MAG: hypothetical protein A2144_10785 [Chloroflexi bacterium RBG_16_50_9]|nr:MAG: hypothetical protein A2144_10785 [Chloroflexi bacterium RBG_16_50_9]
MKTKVIVLGVIVFMLSFLPAYVSGISTPDTAAASATETTPMLTRNEEPAGVSPLAVPIRNLWGAPKGEVVDLTISRSGKVVSWSWSRQHPVTRPGVAYIQPIYPNARITLKSPITVGEIESFFLAADFLYTRPTTGSYSLAYDVSLREKGSKDPKVEIMVWLDWTQKQPPLSLKGFCSDGENIYSKYWWEKADGTAYRSFLLTLPQGVAIRPVNLKALIDLIEPDEDWYISEVELGTEVWSGSGAVELNAYYLELNGVRL